MGTAPNRKGKLWIREEVILAFNLYCKLPFGKLHKTNPDIIALSKIIGRTPDSVAMKCTNLARLDPELQKRGVGGLKGGSKVDEQVWDEFSENWDNLAFESEKLLAEKKAINLSETLGPDLKDLPEGKVKERLVKTRVNQSFFRSSVLSAYQGKCAITGISITELLIASHIVPWSKDKKNRTNPQNGILLNALHDKAFDRGWITIAPDYKILLSKELKDQKDEVYFENNFGQWEHKEIALPGRFFPDRKFLEWHNKEIFKG